MASAESLFIDDSVDLVHPSHVRLGVSMCGYYLLAKTVSVFTEPSYAIQYR